MSGAPKLFVPEGRRRLVDEALVSLADAFLDERPFLAVAHAVGRAFPSSRTAFYDGVAGRAPNVGHTFDSRGDSWATVKCASRLPPIRQFDPCRPDRFANQAVLECELYSDAVESLAELHDALGLDDARHQVRAVLYDGSTYLGFCGAYSERRAKDFDEVDRAVLDQLVPAVRDLLRAARALDSAAGTDVGVMLDAFEQPAFVVTSRGHVAHANRAGRASFAAVGELVRTAARAAARDRELAGVARTRVLLGGQACHLLIPRAHGAASAQRTWPELPASLSRIADMLAQGLSDKEIAVTTDLSYPTVRTYVSRIYERLGVSSRRELMRRAAARSPQ